MFIRKLVSALSVLLLVASVSKSSDVRMVSGSPDSRTVNAPRMSNLTPEQLMQAVRRDLESAVRDHEALADSLRSKQLESNPTLSKSKPPSAQASLANNNAGWEILTSTSNARVEAWESHFSSSGRLRDALLRLGSHRTHLEEVLKQNDLPPELLAVAFVESEFARSAVSSKGATGLWQFMPATAVRYGLELKPFVDDRTDYEKSTVAAARYLTDLHERFGDWLLALAAYNAGEDEVESAIARGRTRDFWALSRLGLLPTETRIYVPKVLGVLRVWNGLVDDNPETELSRTREAASFGNVKLVFTMTSGN